MNKNILLIIGGIVVVGGIAAYFVTGNHSNSGMQSVSPTNETGQRSLKELLSSGATQKCEFSDTASSLSSEGIVYVGGGKMRGDFTAVSSGKTIKSHMVVAGQDTYVWMDGMTTGFKMSIDTSKAPYQKSTTGVQQGIDVSKKINYHCSPWSSDSSLFDLPGSVTFNSMADVAVPGNTVPGSSTGGTQNVKAIQCGACSGLSEPQKSQCRAALSCN